MKYTIDNGIISVTADTLGGELMSIESSEGIEYLWQGDKEYWSGRSPILFPIVGALRDGKAKSAAGEINLPQHGTVRQVEWEMEEIFDTSMTFSVKSTEESKKGYPYDFKLSVSYILAGNTLRTLFSIENIGKETLPFCVGGHPAFNVPLVAGEEFDDYFIEFEHKETASCPMIDMEKGTIIDDKRNRLLTDSNKFGLNHVLFRGDALVFDNLKSRSAKLKSSRSGHGVSMDFFGMDYFAVWSPVKDSPFVCFEPWTGTATLYSEDDIFERKRGMTLLLPEKKSEYSFNISVF